MLRAPHAAPCDSLSLPTSGDASSCCCCCCYSTSIAERWPSRGGNDVDTNTARKIAVVREFFCSEFIFTSHTLSISLNHFSNLKFRHSDFYLS